MVLREILILPLLSLGFQRKSKQLYFLQFLYNKDTYIYIFFLIQRMFNKGFPRAMVQRHYRKCTVN